MHCDLWFLMTKLRRYNQFWCNAYLPRPTQKVIHRMVHLYEAYTGYFTKHENMSKYHSQLTIHEVMQRTGEAPCVRRWNPTHAYRKLSRVVASISRKPCGLSSLVPEVHEWFDHRVINSIHYRYINPWCATTFANSRQMSLYYNSLPNKCKCICRHNGDTV